MYRRKSRRVGRRPVRRRPYRRYRRTGKRLTRYITPGTSKQRFVKLYYCDVDSTTVSASSYQTFPYWSSAYDPYAGTLGHQPMFFDQYAAMYQRYTVMGLAYTLEACTEAVTNGPLFITVTPSSVGASATSLSIARERNGTKETVVTHGYKGRLKGYISCAKTLGVSRTKFLSDDQYSALVTTDPVQPVYLNLQIWNTSGTANISVYVSIRLTFYIRFFDPKEPSQS